MGYVMRKKVVPDDKTPKPGQRVAQVHEGAGCEHDYLHTPGGVEFAREGHTVFASREEAESDDRPGVNAVGAQDT